ncbi:pyridoxamine 5'-phosphate oxidase-related FMN-binding protein [Flexistipes sinusarabici DSM 4947]|uniref:Pyridoxamine 5'-phosphate oxidase-related FMN-binding protein n=1 Tax=Flexistipes sinusarabici (strain ATCC 49648 / DSM 4947 / MAS 10) TaxID=717231 RepID=F8E6C6_FLESM|nr:pyridoxamine 5'-phosphate oxidase family protein [Flexistipes sinusarabici]AEI15893.1 pyridoxamine 5'-phosphate oxidase-related FMN-binding protein [Flexistipes sinusarabici DSM 4947]
MRRKEKEITDKDEIEKIIADSTVCHLGLSDNNTPYIVPMSFGYRNSTVFLHSAQMGRKIDIINNNNDVCVEFVPESKIQKAQEACSWTMKYRSVTGFGKAYLIGNSSDKIEALNVIMSQYSDDSFTFTDKSASKTSVIKIILKEITGKKSGF